MFRTLKLLAHMHGHPEWLLIGNRQMQVRAIQINTSPFLLTKMYGEEGGRAANREELEFFAKEYRPVFTVFAVDETSEATMFGPISRLYKTVRGRVVQATVNPVHGLPADTLVLWVK